MLTLLPHFSSLHFQLTTSFTQASPTTSPLSAIMSDILSEKTTSDVSSDATTSSQRFQDQLESVLKKLKTDRGSITAEEARILTENVAKPDDRAVRIISAVESLAIANKAPHRSLLMAAKDLHAAVDGSSEEATTEILRVAQSIVSTGLELNVETYTDNATELQKAVGHTNAPHPEVEAELQEEIAKIEHKIAQGTVNKTEADRLHSLEARAHGHTEKGGIAAAAQSVVAKRERQLSLSSCSGSVSSPIYGRSRANSRNFTSPQQQFCQERLNEFHHADMAIRPKTEAEIATKSGTDKPHTLEVRANGGTAKSDTSAMRGSVASSRRSRANSKSITSPGEQFRHTKDENRCDTEAFIRPKTEKGTVSHTDTDTLHSRDTRSLGHIGTRSLSATAQSFISRRAQESLGNVSNSSGTEHRKEHSQLDKDLQEGDEELDNSKSEAYKKHLVNTGHDCVNESDDLQLEDGEICPRCGYTN
ncbi:hypothetical protein J4E82_005144 [Alternaria postmessia]|uniref:uncharacterized protein n=1 Tax=Alternaria postmessia TaxID=1187938 RepID=UPI0022251B35|nr:uncharacterized protein J4E82_005144 [Alternaria postmessia]KAI5376149.1 hypothetical protein J4E82_005144 [Alternaria postmessia]